MMDEATYFQLLKKLVGSGTLNRLKRIQELRNCSPREALEFAISTGWLVAEKKADQAKKYIR